MMNDLINNYKADLIEALSKLSNHDIMEVAQALIEARNKGNTIYTMGNGGSGSTASHFVCDLLKGCSYDKQKKFRVVCLNDNIATILAFSNDINFDLIFQEQLKNFLVNGDVVLAISGSGNSENIIKAVEYAKSKKAIVIGFTGFDGGKLRALSDISVNSNIDDMQISEDLHLVVLHILYKILNDGQ